MADYKQDAMDRAAQLRAKNVEMSKLPIGGKSAKMGEKLYFNDDGSQGNSKAASQAYDSTMNIRESEAEDQEERARRAGSNAGEMGQPWNLRFKGSK